VAQTKQNTETCILPPFNNTCHFDFSRYILFECISKSQNKYYEIESSSVLVRREQFVITRHTTIRPKEKTKPSWHLPKESKTDIPIVRCVSSHSHVTKLLLGARAPRDLRTFLFLAAGSGPFNNFLSRMFFLLTSNNARALQRVIVRHASIHSDCIVVP
jgi:hypothetical protein